MNVELQWMDMMAGMEVGSFKELVNQHKKTDGGKRGVIFWDSIISSKIIGPYKFGESIKINAKNKFLDKTFFFEWCRLYSRSFKLKSIFRQD